MPLSFDLQTLLLNTWNHGSWLQDGVWLFVIVGSLIAHREATKRRDEVFAKIEKMEEVLEDIRSNSVDAASYATSASIVLDREFPYPRRSA